MKTIGYNGVHYFQTNPHRDPKFPHISTGLFRSLGPFSILHCDAGGSGFFKPHPALRFFRTWRALVRGRWARCLLTYKYRFAYINIYIYIHINILNFSVLDLGL